MFGPNINWEEAERDYTEADIPIFRQFGDNGRWIEDERITLRELRQRVDSFGAHQLICIHGHTERLGRRHPYNLVIVGRMISLMRAGRRALSIGS